MAGSLSLHAGPTSPFRYLATSPPKNTKSRRALMLPAGTPARHRPPRARRRQCPTMAAAGALAPLRRRVTVARQRRNRTGFPCTSRPAGTPQVSRNGWAGGSAAVVFGRGPETGFRQDERDGQDGWVDTPHRRSVQTPSCLNSSSTQGRGAVSPAMTPLRASSRSRSAIQEATTASEGIRQSPRGERATVPTLGPSAVQSRFHWLAKKRW